MRIPRRCEVHSREERFFCVCGKRFSPADSVFGPENLIARLYRTVLR